MDYRIKIFSRIEEIPRDDWNSLALQAAPILDWEYLYALEKSGSISEGKGYKPSHMALYNGTRLLAFAPLYRRDRAWVEFGDGGLIEFLTELTGLPYNSGLVGHIPYTPIPGYDFLNRPGSNASVTSAILLDKIDEMSGDLGLSTSRIYFVSPQSCLHSTLVEHGYIGLSSDYLMWYNREYRSFDDYLMSFKSSRRTKIKREWRSIRQEGIKMEMVPGTEAPDSFYQDIFLLYRHTWTKHMGFGIRPFLNDSFFGLLGENFRHRSSFSISSLAGKRVAMALFYNKADSLHGRYWGTFREIPFLHFATCYYFPIAYGIEKGIKTIDPGFGGEHKMVRGFENMQISHYIKFYDEKQRRIAYAVLDQMRNQLVAK
ncbi:MAG: peptidogalycan biosysnthesis protein [Syntrophobacteraceae bacterium]